MISDSLGSLVRKLRLGMPPRSSASRTRSGVREAELRGVGFPSGAWEPGDQEFQFASRFEFTRGRTTETSLTDLASTAGRTSISQFVAPGANSDRTTIP